jgi:hypothetical protein
MEHPSEEVLERICDAHWNGQDINGVVFLDKYRHDAINYTLSGTVEVDGKVYGFIIDDGNWDGTVVRAWGDPEDVSIYQPSPREPLTFVPKNHHLEGLALQKYLLLRKSDWFKKIVGEMNYDMHFAPGTKTTSYYREWAEKKGLTIGLLSNLEPKIREKCE